jgi:hypothetical protein
MADQSFQIAVALDVQTAFDSENATIDGLVSGGGSGGGGEIITSDGALLGVRSAGDADSGITIPNFTRILEEKAAVGATRNFSTFLRTAVEGFALTYEVKGNGDTTTVPAAGEAKPHKAYDALMQMAGFTGANGTAPTYVYTPMTSTEGAESTGVTYGTIKLWVGDLAWTLKDCVVETRETVYTPGGIGIRTDNIKVGSVFAFNDGVTFPTFDYENQSSLGAPRIESLSSAYGETRSYQELTISVNNNVEDIPASNSANGIRIFPSFPREITATGTLFNTAADSDFDYQQVISPTANTTPWTYQVGSAAGAAAEVNAYLVEMENPEGATVKYNRSGTVMVGEVELAVVDGTEGAEYTETYN